MAIGKVYDIGIIPYRDTLEERFLFPYNQLNYLTGGGIFDRLTLITSSTNNGKTTLASQIVCECIRQGYKVCAYFGEDRGSEAQQRLYKQYVPFSQDVYESKMYEQNGKATNIREWFIKKEKWDEAHSFFSQKLYLYNTMEKHDIGGILDGFEQARQLGCKLFVVDNFENIEYDGENENKSHKDTAIALRDYAVNKKVHIIAVAHLRKMERELIIPTLDDVKGSSAIANTAKNVLAILRTDMFDATSKEYKRLAALLNKHGYNMDNCDSVLCVLKTKGNRLGYVGLQFDKITNTYKESYKTIENNSNDKKSMFVQKTFISQSIDDLEEDTEDDGEMPF